MEGSGLNVPSLIGREKELEKLMQALADCRSGKGSTILISGEPGVGKTRLLEEFKSIAEQTRVKTFAGSAILDSMPPFEILSKALEAASGSVFKEEEYQTFAKLFAFDSKGRLMGQASAGGGYGVDPQTFAGMVSVVQGFVGESFDGQGQQQAGLNRLEYGDMKIIIEHGRNLLLTAVFNGSEHPDMKRVLKIAVTALERDHVSLTQSWDGRTDSVAPVQSLLDSLALSKFLVKKNLEGVRLDNERLKIANKILEILIEQSKRQPIVLILEDLQWADDSSLFVLSFLARNIRDQGIAILGTYRHAAGDSLPPILESMHSEGTVETIYLDRFSPRDVARVIDEVFTPNLFPVNFRERVQADCQGNAFFVMELLKQMATDGSIAMVGGTFTLVQPDYSAPKTVEEVVSRRLEGLSMEALAIAEYASCIGHEFPLAVAMSNESVSDPGVSLRSLGEMGIIKIDGEHSKFSHAFFHEYLYSNLSQRWKAAHHQRLGAYYETVHANDPEAVAYELARHFYRGGNCLKAADYCFKAGEKAESAFAALQAAQFFEEALESVRRHGRFPDRKVRECRALTRIGANYNLISDFGKSKAAYSEALKLTQDRMEKTEIIRQLSNILAVMGEIDLAWKMVAEELEATGKETAHHWLLEMMKAKLLIYKGELKTAVSVGEAALAELLKYQISETDLASAHNIVGGVLIRMGEYENAMGHYATILELSTKANDHNALANAYNNLGATYQWTGDLDRAISNYTRSLELWQKQGNIFGESSTLSNIGSTMIDRGEFDKASDCLHRSLQIRRRIGNLEGVATSLSNLGALHYRMGDVAKALPYMTDSLEIRLKLGDRFGIANSYNNIGEVQLWRGDLEQAHEYMTKALEIEQDINDNEGIAYSLAHIGFIHLQSGRLKDARDILEKGLAVSREIGLKDYMLVGLRWLIEACIEEGDIASAEIHLADVERLTLEVSLEQESASADRTRGLVLAAKGDYTKAIANLLNAEKRFKDLDMKILHVQTLVSLAEIRMVTGDRSAAAETYSEALAASERLGLVRIIEKCRNALAEL